MSSDEEQEGFQSISSLFEESMEIFEEEWVYEKYSKRNAQAKANPVDIKQFTDFKEPVGEIRKFWQMTKQDEFFFPDFVPLDTDSSLGSDDEEFDPEKVQKILRRALGVMEGVVYYKYFVHGARTFIFEDSVYHNIVDIYALRKRLYNIKDIEKATFKVLLGGHIREINLAEPSVEDEATDKSNQDRSLGIKGSAREMHIKPKDQLNLCFKSNFDSGNLAMVLKGDDGIYYLEMSVDTNSNFPPQWFHFSVTGGKKGQTAIFRVINYTDLLYVNESVCFKSKTSAKRPGRLEWDRMNPDDCFYVPTASLQMDPVVEGKSKSYCLEFRYEFEYDLDTVSFAPTFPYTYEDLQRDALSWQMQTRGKREYVFRKKLLCFTLTGRKLFYYEAYKSKSKIKTTQLKDTQIIVLTCRMNPVETISNHILQGFMEKLFDFEAGHRTPEAFLREHYVFVIIPMLNPDGVSVGNTLASFSGESLNRAFNRADRFVHPESYYTRKLLHTLSLHNEIVMHVEFRMNNHQTETTCYGVEDEEKPGKQQRQFVLLLADRLNNFNLEKSNFSVHRRKGTLSALMWKHFKVPMSFSLQVSSMGTSRLNLYSLKDYVDTGKQFCELLGVYYAAKGITLVSSIELRDKIKQIWSNSFQEDQPERQELTSNTLHRSNSGTSCGYVPHANTKKDPRNLTRLLKRFSVDGGRSMSRMHQLDTGYSKTILSQREGNQSNRSNQHPEISNFGAADAQRQKDKMSGHSHHLVAENVRDQGLNDVTEVLHANKSVEELGLNTSIVRKNSIERPEGTTFTAIQRKAIEKALQDEEWKERIMKINQESLAELEYAEKDGHSDSYHGESRNSITEKMTTGKHLNALAPAISQATSKAKGTIKPKPASIIESTLKKNHQIPMLQLGELSSPDGRNGHSQKVEFDTKSVATAMMSVDKTKNGGTTSANRHEFYKVSYERNSKGSSTSKAATSKANQVRKSGFGQVAKQVIAETESRKTVDINSKPNNEASTPLTKSPTKKQSEITAAKPLLNVTEERIGQLDNTESIAGEPAEPILEQIDSNFQSSNQSPIVQSPTQFTKKIPERTRGFKRGEDLRIQVVVPVDQRSVPSSGLNSKGQTPKNQDITLRQKVPSRSSKKGTDRSLDTSWRADKPSKLIQKSNKSSKRASFIILSPTLEHSPIRPHQSEKHIDVTETASVIHNPPIKGSEIVGKAESVTKNRKHIEIKIVPEVAEISRLSLHTNSKTSEHDVAPQKVNPSVVPDLSSDRSPKNSNASQGLSQVRWRPTTAAANSSKKLNSKPFVPKLSNITKSATTRRQEHQTSVIQSQPSNKNLDKINDNLLHQDGSQTTRSPPNPVSLVKSEQKKQTSAVLASQSELSMDIKSMALQETVSKQNPDNFELQPTSINQRLKFVDYAEYPNSHDLPRQDLVLGSDRVQTGNIFRMNSGKTVAAGRKLTKKRSISGLEDILGHPKITTGARGDGGRIHLGDSNNHTVGKPGYIGAQKGPGQPDFGVKRPSYMVADRLTAQKEVEEELLGLVQRKGGKFHSLDNRAPNRILSNSAIKICSRDKSGVANLFYQPESKMDSRYLQQTILAHDLSKQEPPSSNFSSYQSGSDVKKQQSSIIKGRMHQNQLWSNNSAATPATNDLIIRQFRDNQDNEIYQPTAFEEVYETAKIPSLQKSNQKSPSNSTNRLNNNFAYTSAHINQFNPDLQDTQASQLSMNHLAQRPSSKQHYGYGGYLRGPSQASSKQIVPPNSESGSLFRSLSGQEIYQSSKHNRASRVKPAVLSQDIKALARLKKDPLLKTYLSTKPTSKLTTEIANKANLISIGSPAVSAVGLDGPPASNTPKSQAIFVQNVLETRDPFASLMLTLTGDKQIHFR